MGLVLILHTVEMGLAPHPAVPAESCLVKEPAGRPDSSFTDTFFEQLYSTIQKFLI